MNPDQEPRSGEYIPKGARHGAQASWSRVQTRFIRIPAMGTLGFGTMLAITISYVHNHSIGWAIVHGLLSWLFVIYAALFY